MSFLFVKRWKASSICASVVSADGGACQRGRGVSSVKGSSGRGEGGGGQTHKKAHLAISVWGERVTAATL